MATNDFSDGAAGVVSKINPPLIFVHTDGRDLSCRLAASARASQNDHGQSLVVGDKVCIGLLPDGSGEIIQILPRRNTLSRRSAVPMPGAHAHEQFIAANLELVVPVFAAANPAPRWHLLDRYLVLAEMVEAPALICITKSDLARDKDNRLSAELAAALNAYEQLGYPVVVTSAQDGSGIETMRQALYSKQSVLLGKSGVGKTSLLNALQPGLGLRVNEVNRVTGKGRHTTSQAVLFHLDSGGDIIDTPGIREFGLWDILPEDLALYFVEMRPLVGRCRFGLGCRHVEEPGCAVRQAVTSGQISPQRYQSYIKLLEEDCRHEA